MKTDYKLWYVKRDDNGFITEATVRFFEGEITIAEEYEKGMVERYRRTARLQENDLKHLKNKFKKDKNGNDAKLYDTSDFGQIKTDEELVAFLDTEIIKDPDREYIDG